MLRGFGSKQPSALGLPIEHPLQPCDSEQARLEGQNAQMHNITITWLDHNLLLHHLQEQQLCIDEVTGTECLSDACDVVLN